MTRQQIESFIAELTANLSGNILPYWVNKMQDPSGGFYGRRDGMDRLHPLAERGAILNFRILWTFASAARVYNSDICAGIADRQYRYVAVHFIDKEFGGVYWSINPDGTPAQDKKQFYAIAFAIYALAEYVKLTGSEDALSHAIDLFRKIENHSRDRRKGGYLEATTRDWQPIADMRLSDKDLNSSKTMNTHLHILEAYTNLLRVWRSDEAVEATRSLIKLFLDKIIDPSTHHMGLFFDDYMERVDDDISFGHDIEASWLLLEAALEVGDKKLIEKTRKATRRLALAALEGRCDDGSMLYERDAAGHCDEERHWWVQAENVVGQIYLAALHDMPEQLDRALESWRYIESQLVDRDGGEWYWSRLPDGEINRRDDKAGFWKCPYHNSRMCIEGVERLSKLLDK